MVGQQLQWDGCQQGEERFEGCGESNHIIGFPCELPGPIPGGNGDDRALTGFDLLQVGEGLLEHAVVGDDENRGGALVDHGDGAMLHFGCGVTLGMDVGDFLELERTFQGDGEIELAPQEEEVFCLLVFEGDLPDLVVQGEDLFHLFREGLKCGDPFHAASVG